MSRPQTGAGQYDWHSGRHLWRCFPQQISEIKEESKLFCHNLCTFQFHASALPVNAKLPMGVFGIWGQASTCDLTVTGYGSGREDLGWGVSDRWTESSVHRAQQSSGRVWATCHLQGSKLKSEKPWAVTRALEKGVLAGEWINNPRKVWSPEVVSRHWAGDEGEAGAGQSFRSGWIPLILLIPRLEDPNGSSAFIYFPSADECLSACLLSRFSCVQLFAALSACLLSRFSCVQLFAALWTGASWAPLSMGFFRQEYWSGLPCPLLGDWPRDRTHVSSVSCIAGRFFTQWATWEDWWCLGTVYFAVKETGEVPVLRKLAI